MYSFLQLLGAPLEEQQCSNCRDEGPQGFLGDVLEPAEADMLLNPSWTASRIGGSLTCSDGCGMGDGSSSRCRMMPQRLWMLCSSGCATSAGMLNTVSMPTADACAKSALDKR